MSESGKEKGSEEEGLGHEIQYVRDGRGGNIKFASDEMMCGQRSLQAGRAGEVMRAEAERIGSRDIGRAVIDEQHRCRVRIADRIQRVVVDRRIRLLKWASMAGQGSDGMFDRA